ncbi:MAG TPA: PilX N-terminal domain-containing pilus assembly protein [Candidatus Acidoferrales bacterium]|nr:PilX N-terminal domain-containing pilus assembly protein [Candidatus Acidoferrales bacterium]
MRKRRQDSRGFTLIAALLLTLLLSALAVGLLYMVTNEQRMGGNDLEGNMAYYGAESGIENLTAQLSQLYQSSQTPDAASILALTSPANYPTAIAGSNITGMFYNEPPITWPLSDPAGNPKGTWDIVGAGSDQGMVASLIQFNLQVTATRASSAGEASNNNALSNRTGASVNLTRTVEVALLPAFEFGVFCDGDCDYFAGPNFNFGGRVHTNGSLFLASGGSNLTFTDKIAVVDQVVLDQLENGWPTSNQYGGQVWVPNASGGCPAAPTPGPGPTPALCSQLTVGSWTGGFPHWAGAANTANWTASSGPFNGFIINGQTGATKLQLPFVQNSKVGAIDIIRRPTPVDTTLLTNSRLYQKAQIRILLADTIKDLHPERGVGVLDANDVQLGTPSTGFIPLTAGPFSPANMYYAVAQNGVGNWINQAPTGCTPTTLVSWPLHGQVTWAGNQCQSVWLRVEYCPLVTGCQSNPGSWVGVTKQWLGYGFGRPYNTAPTAPYQAAGAPACPTYPATPAGQCYNPISPAILILQQLQAPKPNSAATGAAGTANNWIPINFYDSREGEPRDSRPAGDIGTNCSPNGIMNAVELDTGNLWLWLQGAAPYGGGNGPLVDKLFNNGYILYFSDHRGMLPDTHPLLAFYNSFSGMSGLNDTVNSSNVNGVPSGTLEPITYYATAPTPYSPEDTAIKGPVLGGNVDLWGEANLGAGFGVAAAGMNQPYWINGSTNPLYAVQCYAAAAGPDTAEWNMVTGPRHVLRLVDGGMNPAGTSSYLPHPIAPATSGYGFTIASEEPVYVWGNYNTGPLDPLWPAGGTPTTPHSAAAIIADAVTLLSNPPSAATVPTSNVGWTDLESFQNPHQAVKVSGPPAFAGRQGNTSYYRMAIAAGKSIPFPEPGWASAAGLKDFGTDGGMHNFLRYLEDRSDNGNGAIVNYAGSLISMYYSQYATGVFKCCNSTYSAPVRNYFFDTQFLNPANLPPGTPMFQDVVSLGFHQSFAPQ